MRREGGVGWQFGFDKMMNENTKNNIKHILKRQAKQPDYNKYKHNFAKF